MMKMFMVFFFTIALGICSLASPVYAASHNMKIAMVSDYSGIADQSFNQTIYEACRAYAQAEGAPFACFQPLENTSEERVRIISEAAKQGYTVIVTAGDSFVDPLKSTAQVHPEADFIAIDVSQERLGNYTLPKNFYGVVYREEISGYMAGYAAVKLGYRKLGYLGGRDIPSVRRYGYGFVQGINDAAGEEKLENVTVNYAYAGQFEPSAEITEAMNKWYESGVQVVLPCGGLHESVADAAENANGKIIGIDIDQSEMIDAQYSKGMTVTSAMKDLSGAVHATLNKIGNGTFEGGQIEILGIVSEDPMKNYVKLPIGTTQWNSSFSQKDYQVLVRKIFKGEIQISNDIGKHPSDYASNIKLVYSDTLLPQ